MAALHSPQQMAERIAALVDASPMTALHVSRILQRYSDAEGKRLDLWPRPGSGARITSYAPTQMVNLLLALAAGEPIRGPEIVAGLRGLQHGTVYWTHTRRVLLNALQPDRYLTIDSRFPSKEPPLLGPTLGDDLDDLVEWLANDALPDPANVRERLRSARIILTLKPRFAAMIVVPAGDDYSEEIHYGEEQAAASPYASMRLLDGSAGETVGVMEALSTIWRENQEALRPPINETAAVHPCQGTNAAAPSQSSAPEREPGLQTSPVLPVRETSLNGFAAGPPFIVKERPDARYRQLSADGAGG